MPELQQFFYRHAKYILYLLSIYVLGWGFTEYKSIFMGLILGTSVSLFNHWNLYRKTKRMEKVVEEEKKIYGIGTLTRMATAVLAVFIAMEYPTIFHLTSVIIGLVTAFSVIMIDTFLREVFNLLRPKK